MRDDGKMVVMMMMMIWSSTEKVFVALSEENHSEYRLLAISYNNNVKLVTLTEGKP